MAPEPQQFDKTRSLKTSLLIAAKTGKTSKVRQLLKEEKLNVDLRSRNGKTPLMLALEGRHEQTIAALFAYRPNIHARCPTGESVLQVALKLSRRDIGIVQMFLHSLKEEYRGKASNLASVLMNFGCSLYLAAFLRSSEVLRLMIQGGCPVNYKDPETLQTALHVAVALEDCSSVKLLVECGADVDATDSNGQIPLADCHSSFDPDEELQMLRLLTDKCTKLTTLDNNGLMPVRSALMFGRKDALELLLRCEIDWCATDFFNMSPLYYLAANKALVDNQDVLDGLRDKVIYDSSRDRAAMRLLPFASQHGVTKLVEMLLDRGVDVNTRNSDGTTALFSTAQFRGSVELVEESRKIFAMLLQRGADPQIVSDSGLTVFDSIEKCENFHLAEAAIGQLVVDESLGIPIGEAVRSAINCNSEFYHQLQLCEKQVEELKGIGIRHSVTLFDVFTASEKKMMVYARNDEFFDKMADFKLYCSNLYFDQALRRKFEKTIRLAGIWKNVADIVCQCMGINYDAYPTIVDKISDYILCM